MTKTNHRLQSLVPSRRTPAAYGRAKDQDHEARGRDYDMRAMAYFDYAFHTANQRCFGKREPSGLFACAANCGHAACKGGCTLLGRFD
jgi:hypothetical protein